MWVVYSYGENIILMDSYGVGGETIRSIIPFIASKIYDENTLLRNDWWNTKSS
jgi:hypothetical protein